MSEKFLAWAFWIIAAGLLVFSVAEGGWALLIPLAAFLALLLFGLDLLGHRELVEFDRNLLRTLLHVLSAVVLASTCMYWLVRLLITRGG